MMHRKKVGIKLSILKRLKYNFKKRKEKKMAKKKKKKNKKKKSKKGR